MRDRVTAALAASGVMALLSGIMVMGTAGTARAADGDEECVPSAATTTFEWSVDSPGEGFSQTGDSRFIETAPAVPAVPEISSTTYEYSWVEVTQEYVPAVYEIEYEFVNTQNSNLPPRWSTDPGWNANGNNSSQGWQSTGATRNGALITPAQLNETVTHTDWFSTDPGGAWEPTGESVTVVTQEGVGGKNAEGYTEYEWLSSVPAVVCDGASPPGGAGEEPPAVEPPVVGGVEAETPVTAPAVKGVQAEAPAAKPVVKGVSAEAPASGKARTSVQVPLAVDAGLGAPSAGRTATASLLGQGLMVGGLMLLLLAGWTRKGQLSRGAHQV